MTGESLHNYTLIKDNVTMGKVLYHKRATSTNMKFYYAGQNTFRRKLN